MLYTEYCQYSISVFIVAFSGCMRFTRVRGSLFAGMPKLMAHRKTQGR